MLVTAESLKTLLETKPEIRDRAMQRIDEIAAQAPRRMLFGIWQGLSLTSFRTVTLIVLLCKIDVSRLWLTPISMDQMVGIGRLIVG